MKSSSSYSLRLTLLIDLLIIILGIKYSRSAKSLDIFILCWFSDIAAIIIWILSFLIVKEVTF